MKKNQFKTFITKDIKVALSKFEELTANYEDVRMSTMNVSGLLTRYFIEYRFEKEAE